MKERTDQSTKDQLHDQIIQSIKDRKQYYSPTPDKGQIGSIRWQIKYARLNPTTEQKMILIITIWQDNSQYREKDEPYPNWLIVTLKYLSSELNRFIELFF